MDPTRQIISGRTFGVKICTGPYIDSSLGENSQVQNDRRSFINSIGKIGDLEVLNDIAGPIGEGLRTLTQTSNAIRTGCGAMPSIIGDSIDSGIDWVLGSMGIAKPVVDTLQGFNPGAVNHALGNARQIYDMVKSGKFKITDVPYYLQEFQNLERLIRGIYTPSQKQSKDLHKPCDASPYAVDLNYLQPKFKFLFLVQFKMDPSFPDMEHAMGNTAFVIKKTTRPKVKFTNEEVNYYNHRTTVTTRSEYEDIEMTFHDDNMNFAHNFFKKAVNTLVPSSNTPQYLSRDQLEDYGMNFNNGSTGPDPGYMASIGPLLNDSKQQIFQEIILYHVYGWGHNAVLYHFYNPHISVLELDDLDMAEGANGSEIRVSFKYDYLWVETKNMEDLNLEGLQPQAVYPLRFNSAGKSTEGPNKLGVPPYGKVDLNPMRCNPLNTKDTRTQETPPQT